MLKLEAKKKKRKGDIHFLQIIILSFKIIVYKQFITRNKRKYIS